MKELEQEVLKAFTGLVSSGRIQEIVEKQVEATVKSILDDCLRSYSPFGKALREGIEAELKLDVSKLGLGGYNEMLLDVVRRKLSYLIDTNWKKDLEKSLEDILRAAPATIKVSKLLEELRDDYDEDAESEEWEYATCIVEDAKHGGDLRWLYFDPAPKSTSYECKYRMLVGKDGLAATIWIEGKKNERLLAGPVYGFERVVFQVRTAKVKIEFDLPTGEHTSDHYSWAQHLD